MITIIAGGPPASGKTSIIKHFILFLQRQQRFPAVCKIDCIQSHDDLIYKQHGIPVAQGLSENICPDHYLATNLMDIFQWGKNNQATHLCIETAGLCNRCAPFINRAVNLCVIDCVSSIRGSEKLGPLVTTADILVLTKADLVSQAEREVFSYHLKGLNPNALVQEVNGLTGFGMQRLGQLILQKGIPAETLEEDQLRYTMPSANCAYCVGEIRIGAAYQQGMVHKISFATKDGDANDNYN